MSSPVLWYVSQATGLVSLLMFTLVMLLGVAVAGHGRLPGLPRFSVVSLHRSISLTATVFLAVHIATAVLDSYVGISVWSSVVPFASSYDPLWIGLGAVAVDLMLAVIVSSLLRSRISARIWRAIHWFGYACWPVAVVHGIGIGEGKGSAMNGWQLWLTLVCIAAVIAAVAWRVAAAKTRSRLTGSPARVLHATGRPAARSGAGVHT